MAVGCARALGGFQYAPCDHLGLNFCSAFKDIQNPSIAKNAADFIFQREAVTPMDLQPIIGRCPGHAA